MTRWMTASAVACSYGSFPSGAVSPVTTCAVFDCRPRVMPDVQGLPGKRVRDQHVRGIDGPALRHVDIARVMQFGVTGEVGQRHQERVRPAPAGQLADHLRVLALPALDAEHVPVGQPLPAGVDPGVEPGPDQVPGAGLVPVRQRCTGLHHGPHRHELGLHAPCKLGCFLVRPGEQDRVPPVQVIRQPCARGTVICRLPVIAPDPAAPVIGRRPRRNHPPAAGPRRPAPTAGQTACTSDSSAAPSSAMSAGNMPPASTGPSWNGSPVGTTSAPARSA